MDKTNTHSKRPTRFAPIDDTSEDSDGPSYRQEAVSATPSSKTYVPELIVAAGTFMHVAHDVIVFKSAMGERVPYCNAPLYAANK
jgi:hypothetical protein